MLGRRVRLAALCPTGRTTAPRLRAYPQRYQSAAKAESGGRGPASDPSDNAAEYVTFAAWLELFDGVQGGATAREQRSPGSSPAAVPSLVRRRAGNRRRARAPSSWPSHARARPSSPLQVPRHPAHVHRAVLIWAPRSYRCPQIAESLASRQQPRPSPPSRATDGAGLGSRKPCWRTRHVSSSGPRR